MAASNFLVGNIRALYKCVRIQQCADTYLCYIGSRHGGIGQRCQLELLLRGQFDRTGFAQRRFVEIRYPRNRIAFEDIVSRSDSLSIQINLR